mgnify:CR=1 FL=1
MDEQQKEKLMATCSCGSGKMAKDCCMVSPETHDVDKG